MVFEIVGDGKRKRSRREEESGGVVVERNSRAMTL